MEHYKFESSNLGTLGILEISKPTAIFTGSFIPFKKRRELGQGWMCGPDPARI
jgi:hypothetical protein